MKTKQTKRRLKKGDSVIVLKGRDKGRVGKVMNFTAAARVVVEGINLRKKSAKPNPKTGESGGIVEKEVGISMANVAIYNFQTKKADKIGMKILTDGKKVRIFKSNQEMIDV